MEDPVYILLHLLHHRDLKVSLEIFVHYDCVHLAIGGRGHVTKHIWGSTVHNLNKNKSRKSEKNTELSKWRWHFEKNVLVSSECKVLADQFVPELVETLASQMNPDTWVALISQLWSKMLTLTRKFCNILLTLTHVIPWHVIFIL